MICAADSSRVCRSVWTVTSGFSGAFVRRGDAGELLDLAGARLFVEALRVALLADFERRVDEDFDEIAPAFERDLAGAVAVGAVRAR